MQDSPAGPSGPGTDPDVAAELAQELRAAGFLPGDLALVERLLGHLTAAAEAAAELELEGTDPASLPSWGRVGRPFAQLAEYLLRRTDRMVAAYGSPA